MNAPSPQSDRSFPRQKCLYDLLNIHPCHQIDVVFEPSHMSPQSHRTIQRNKRLYDLLNKSHYDLLNNLAGSH